MEIMNNTLNGIKYLDSDDSMDMVGFSIPTAEHITITAWGKEFEFNAYHMIVLTRGNRFSYDNVTMEDITENLNPLHKKYR